MSGYFRRIAKLARPGTPGHSLMSPFGPPKPPVSQSVQPPTETVSDVALTPSPEVATPGPGIAPSLLQPEAASRRKNPESGAVTASTRQATDVATPTQPPVSGDQKAPRSIGEMIASDVSRMGLSSRGLDEMGRAAQLPRSGEPQPSSPVLMPKMTAAPTFAPDLRKSLPQSRQPAPDAPVVQSRPNAAADGHPPSDPPPMAPAPLRAGTAAPVSDADRQSTPQRVLIRAEQSAAVSESWPDTRLHRPASATPPDEPAVAAALSGPRGRPDVEVSIGAINLSTEPPLESPKPAPKVRPMRAAHSATGIWSGGRAFARSYLRRG